MSLWTVNAAPVSNTGQVYPRTEARAGGPHAATCAAAGDRGGREGHVPRRVPPRATATTSNSSRSTTTNTTTTATSSSSRRPRGRSGTIRGAAIPPPLPADLHAGTLSRTAPPPAGPTRRRTGRGGGGGRRRRRGIPREAPREEAQARPQAARRWPGGVADGRGAGGGPAESSAEEEEGAGVPAGNKRKRKIREIGDVSGAADGEKGEKPLSGSKSTASHQGTQMDSGPSTPLPDKKLLVFILDRLQKKDTYGVFSEPVDPKELPDYHEVIEHPMDFGTVRKKLAGGAYASLEHFEKDVFLICSNAMQYNAPDTIYFRQARAIQELAKRILRI
ncbi:hypothetical protein NL676_015276 [Syzygium grande]|nr:hypothetical protein NL676_015276 [Syzygium grande]